MFANVGEVSQPSRAAKPGGVTLEPGIAAETPFMPDFGQMSVGELQRVKNELSKQIDILSRATDTPSAVQLTQLQNARQMLTATMAAQSGNYRLANQIFKNLSVPQNQGEVANVLLKALRSPGGRERNEAFLSAMGEAATTVKRAGQPRFKTIEEAMGGTQSPAMREVRQIGRSVQREADYANLPAGTSTKIEGTLSKLENAVPTWFSPAITAVRHIAKKLGADTDEAAQVILDQATLDPKRLSELLSSTLPQDRSAVLNYVFNKTKQMQQNPEIMGALTAAAIGNQ